eukprot:COSAG04_NODE_2021_length_4981_cov_8.331012_2_plen_352_part_00
MGTDLVPAARSGVHLLGQDAVQHQQRRKGVALPPADALRRLPLLGPLPGHLGGLLEGPVLKDLARDQAEHRAAVFGARGQLHARGRRCRSRRRRSVLGRPRLLLRPRAGGAPEEAVLELGLSERAHPAIDLLHRRALCGPEAPQVSSRTPCALLRCADALRLGVRQRDARAGAVARVDGGAGLVVDLPAVGDGSREVDIDARGLHPHTRRVSRWAGGRSSGREAAPLGSKLAARRSRRRRCSACAGDGRTEGRHPTSPGRNTRRRAAVCAPAGPPACASSSASRRWTPLGSVRAACGARALWAAEGRSARYSCHWKRRSPELCPWAAVEPAADGAPALPRGRRRLRNSPRL